MGRFVTAGNVIWCDALKEHENRHRHGKQKDITESHTRRYALSICESLIRGFVWIKRNGKKVYGGDWEAASEENWPITPSSSEDWLHSRNAERLHLTKRMR